MNNDIVPLEYRTRSVRRRSLRSLFAIALVLMVALPATAQIKRRDDAPQPLTPEKSLDSFRLPDGLRIELVAAEPLVADPVVMAFDAQGRIFVGEIHGYNVDGHIDITELNKKGVLDKEVRRILVDEETLKKANEQTFGVVKLLEDTDGDGRMDKVTVWADDIPACFGVVPARDGVIVLCAPDILYLGDTDGDGKPDVRETLFTGFGVGELWTRINNPLRGIDNWIYVGTGIDADGTITGPNLPEPVELGFTSFRFKTDGSALEPVTGAAHGFGQTMNAWNDRFLCTNQEHAVMSAALPYRYLMRNPHIATPDPVLNISSYGHPAKLYPIATQHPWRTERERQPQWVKFYGSKETSSGLVTSACGPLVYDADGLSADFLGDHFSCEPSQNLVHHCKITRDGLRYSVQRPENEQEVEFLASTETWFRPVNLSIGPDGALYIVDMYREIIEDYSAIPRYLQQQYGLIEGHKRGRIWRVVPQDRQKKGVEHSVVGSPSTDKFVDILNAENRWQRQTAQQQLVERQDKSSLAPLIELVRSGKLFPTRLHALYTLKGLDALTPEILGDALRDDHFSIRVHALQLAESWLDRSPDLLTQVIAMGSDREPRVQLQLAMTLGETRDPRGLPVLAGIAHRNGDDAWMRAAILSSVVDSAGELLTQIVSTPQEASSHSSHLIEPLATIVGARGNAGAVSRVLEALLTIDEPVGEVSEGQSAASQSAVVTSILQGLASGLKQGELSGPLPKKGSEALASLLKTGAGESRNQAFSIARSVGLTETSEMKSIFATAAKDATNSELPLASRQAALQLLGNAPFSSLANITDEILDSGQASDLQIAAIKALSASDSEEVTGMLLENWSSYTPKVRAAAIEAIFSRTSRLSELLDAIEQEDIAPHEIDAFHRVQLRENSNDNIRDRSQTLLTQSDSGASDEVIATYVAALDQPRDLKRGEAVFVKTCATCHRFGGVGHTVGPDLAAAKGRADETLLLDILRPSAQITVGYQGYSIMTIDGHVATGILTSETATSITLKKDEGVEQIVLRADIDEMQASPVSMMPEGLEKQITPQEAADLIGFLRKSLGPSAPESVTLFDDDPQFVDLLNEGTGTARIDQDAPFVGKSSLRITPPQRFSPRIEGWEFRIRENPQPGEYRYLRFAWKSSDGKGIMLELADEGEWPGRFENRLRYLSGENSTHWDALVLSTDPPTQWTLVTRDLWKDFGDFTLTGMAPTAMGAEARFDGMKLLRSLESTDEK